MGIFVSIGKEVIKRSFRVDSVDIKSLRTSAWSVAFGQFEHLKNMHTDLCSIDS